MYVCMYAGHIRTLASACMSGVMPCWSCVFTSTPRVMISEMMSVLWIVLHAWLSALIPSSSTHTTLVSRLTYPIETRFTFGVSVNACVEKHGKESWRRRGFCASNMQCCALVSIDYIHIHPSGQQRAAPYMQVSLRKHEDHHGHSLMYVCM